jgi:5-methylcytosine-specific restriction endonuclease McrA
MDTVFMFHLNLVCGGFAYYSADTEWINSGEHGREIRKPTPVVKPDVATQRLEALGQFAFYVDNDTSYEHWLFRRGWAFVSKSYGQSTMSHWIGKRTCVKSPLNTYTDVQLCSERALGRLSRGQQRLEILERENQTCLRCGESTDNFEIHHVRAFSRGGETLKQNLVALCTECNSEIGTNHISELYDLAGIPHGYDSSLIRASRTFGSHLAAVQFSDNMVHTRCEIW